MIMEQMYYINIIYDDNEDDNDNNDNIIVYFTVYFHAIFMYTPMFLCFQELKGPNVAKTLAAKVNFWPL